MDSFEDLEVAPEVIEALAAEGIERPTLLQQQAIPVLRQGNNLVLSAGPGSGLLVAWVVPVLGGLDPDGGFPQALALTDDAATADRLAESTARLAAAYGLAVGALGSTWLSPASSQLLFGTSADVLAASAAGDLDLSRVGTLVVDQAQRIERSGGLEEVERVIAHLGESVQRVVTALPLSAGVTDLAERHVRRALTLPSQEPSEPPRRGRIRFRIVSEPTEVAALAITGELLADEAQRVLLFSRSEDRAADLGDHLTLHGFEAGAVGDLDVPVWLGTDPLSARGSAREVEGVLVVSHDVPADPDELDRRHSIGADGSIVLVRPREVAHLRDVCRRAGYEPVPFPPPTRKPSTDLEELRTSLVRVLEARDSSPYLAVLEPLFERYDAAEVAAAAVSLLKAKQPPAATTAERPASPGATPAPAWAKLFLSVGERDGLRPGDLLGAITGEARVDGRSVGKIDIRESHSVVEVHDSVAQQVIKALNGTTIKGRAVRADFDRPRRGTHRAPRSR